MVVSLWKVLQEMGAPSQECLYCIVHRRSAERQILAELGIVVDGYTIVHDMLDKRKLCAKFVPRSLITLQRNDVWMRRSFVEWADLLQNTVSVKTTGDESWCLQYDTPTKSQIAEWCA